MADVGFIGLGNMGGPMAKNLVQAGHRVKGFDIVPAALKAAKSNGIDAVSDARAAVEGVEVVISMLPAGAHVRAAYLDPDGIIAGVADGTLLIDCSTIDVTTALPSADY